MATTDSGFTIDMTDEATARYAQLAALKSVTRLAQAGLKTRAGSPLTIAKRFGYTGKRSLDNLMGWITHEMDQMLAARAEGDA